MNVAIITARAGSKSIKNKNVYPVLGKPMITYPIQAAKEASKVDRVYVSTDGQSIAEVAQSLGCEVIWRPAELAGDHVNHGDVIKPAVEYVDRPELENIVILLGNTVMVDAELIDEGLSILQERKDLDSVMSVWEAADDHPMRALEIKNGVLSPYGDPNRSVSTERQSYPPAYYFDQGIWVFRKQCIYSKDGPNPWWWMGKRCLPIVRPWVTGRDVHTYLDIALAEWWLREKPHLNLGRSKQWKNDR